MQQLVAVSQGDDMLCEKSHILGYFSHFCNDKITESSLVVARG